MQSNEKRIIWQDSSFEDEEDYREYYDEYINAEGISEQDYPIDRFIEDENEFAYEAEKENLDDIIPEGIVVLARVGLWNRTLECVSAHDIANLNECLCGFAKCDSYRKVYVENGDLCMDEFHHDGTNNYRFRKWKATATIEDKEKAIEGNDIALAEALTESLAPEVARIYGW